MNSWRQTYHVLRNFPWRTNNDFINIAAGKNTKCTLMEMHYRTTASSIPGQIIIISGISICNKMLF